MFQKALHEDLNGKKPAKPQAMTLTQKHRITKKKGDGRPSQIVMERKTVPTSAANIGGGSQFSHRNQGPMEVTGYPEQKVGFFD